MSTRNKDGGLSVGKNIAWNSFGSLVYAGANWLITVLAVVLADGYSVSGDLAFCMAVGNIVATIVLFKTRPVQVADVHDRYSAGEYIGSKVASSAAAVVFGVGYAMISVPYDSWIPVFAYMLFKLVESFVDVYHGIDQKFDRLDYVGISQVIRGIGILVSFVAAMVLFGNLTIAIGLMTVVSLLSILVYDLPRSAKFTSLRPSFELGHILSLLKRCSPGFIASILATFVVSLSRQEYGNVYGSELLGIFAALSTPAVIVQAMASYVYAPLLGPIARSWAAGDRASIIRMVVRFVLVLAAIIIVSIVVFSVAGQQLFTIVYGSEVAEHVSLMPVILLSTGMTAAMLFLLDLLVVVGGYWAACLSGLVSFFVCLMASGPLVSFLSMSGICIAIIVAYGAGVVVVSIMMVLILRRE